MTATPTTHPHPPHHPKDPSMSNLTDLLADLENRGLNVPRWLGDPSQTLGESPADAMAVGNTATEDLAADILAALDNIRDRAEARREADDRPTDADLLALARREIAKAIDDLDGTDPTCMAAQDTLNDALEAIRAVR